MSALAPGQRFGAYVVEACVGQGGMGAVYRARDTKLGRLVALKVIRVAADDGSSLETGPKAETVARFLGEARLGASLSHPNIAVVFEAGAVDDTPYLAMEWLDGRPLSELMRNDALTLPQRLTILEGVADALAHAHARAVIHRDVKPSNVMVDARGTAKLVDFGIAKRTRPLADPGTMMLATHARALLGTPAYMAPEQMLSPAVDARADQFSWAVMAYELLGGAHPNAVVPEDGPAFPVAKAPPLSWRRPELPDAVAAVVHRAMGYEPGARFPSTDELLYAWRSAQGMPSSPGASGILSMGGTTTPQRPTFEPAMASTVGTSAGTLPPRTIPTHPPPYAQPQYAQPSYAPPVHAQSIYAPHPPPPPKRFPWVVVVAIMGALLASAATALVFVLSGSGGPASLASPLGPLASGPRKAFIESGLEDLELAASPAEIAKLKADLETRLTPCFDARVPKDKSFRATVFVTAEGKVSKLEELEVCNEIHPSFYQCTEFGEKKPKRGFPTAPDEVFTCMRRTLEATKFPRLKSTPGKVTPVDDATLHIELH